MIQCIHHIFASKFSEMKQFISGIIIVIGITSSGLAQMSPYKFGQGLNVLGKDSSFSMKAAFRFQNLFDNSWTISGDDFGKVEELKSKFMVRRARFKFDGFAYTPKLKYKFEIGLSNRDISHDGDAYFGKGASIIYDAYVQWNFYKGFSLQAGQAKLPGNRERVISSANMQFVDRSILNAAFNLDRDIGIMLIHDGRIGKARTKLIAALSQGAGRNVTSGNFDGYEYTFRGELLPFGSFTSKGDYFGSDLVREEKPKLSIGASYDYNEKSVRSRNNLGGFLVIPDAKYKNISTGFIDMMFKFKGFSFMGEYAIRATHDRDAQLYDINNVVIGKYTTGAAINLQAGYLFQSNYELAFRYAQVNPQNSIVGNREKQYMIGLSRFVVGHKLKVQTDIGYYEKENKDDALAWRVQMEIHF